MLTCCFLGSPFQYFSSGSAACPHRHTHSWAPVFMLPQRRVNIARLYLCCESMRQSVSLFRIEREEWTESSSRSCDRWSEIVVTQPEWIVRVGGCGFGSTPEANLSETHWCHRAATYQCATLISFTYSYFSSFRKQLQKQSRLLRANDVSCFLRVVSGTDAPTCYRPVTVLINIGASGGLIYYCAPGRKLSWVSSYTAQGVSSDKGPSAVLP